MKKQHEPGNTKTLVSNILLHWYRQSEYDADRLCSEVHWPLYPLGSPNGDGLGAKSVTDNSFDKSLLSFWSLLSLTIPHLYLGCCRLYKTRFRKKLKLWTLWTIHYQYLLALQETEEHTTICSLVKICLLFVWKVAQLSFGGKFKSRLARLKNFPRNFLTWTDHTERDRRKKHGTTSGVKF